MKKVLDHKATLSGWTIDAIDAMRPHLLAAIGEGIDVALSSDECFAFFALSVQEDDLSERLIDDDPLTICIQAPMGEDGHREPVYAFSPSDCGNLLSMMNDCESGWDERIENAKKIRDGLLALAERIDASVKIGEAAMRKDRSSSKTPRAP